MPKQTHANKTMWGPRMPLLTLCPHWTHPGSPLVTLGLGFGEYELSQSQSTVSSENKVQLSLVCSK